MPTNVGYRSDHPAQEGTAGAAGYVGTTADAAGNAPALIPAQYAPNDVMDLQGSGAPVDGTSGTGAGQAGKGSRYIDITAGQMYLNGGTKASPTWKLVTRAA